MSNNQALSICVFCGASEGDSPAYAEIGYKVGELLGTRRHRLVYGAGGIGVMGAVARGTAECGGMIVGIIPAFLRQREMKDKIPPQEVIITRDLSRRKSMMLEISDGFLVLPGGYGTLDELLEVISMTALGIENRPIVLLNAEGFWEPFVEFIDTLVKREFIPAHRHFTLADSPAEAIDRIELAARADRITSGG